MANSLFIPRLTVVGAGPGDPELLTLKGARVLGSADVVLYDALANEALLVHVRPDAPRIFVGKRRGFHGLTQAEINDLIVAQAYRYGHVVRLKGGDPFVFGRGREEMLYAEQHGLSTEYVPGISSAIAAAGSLGIPATHRGLSEGFRVLTATTADGQLSAAVAEAAQSPRTTTIILMGLNRLADITALFGRHGGADVPAAVVQDGTLPTARLVTGTVADIAAKAARAGLRAPAIIVVGEVVRLATGAAAALPAGLADLLTEVADYAKVA
ncbi:uroporphyrinogen-III C-methyltransferase [Hymenobacter rubidus]|uniref:uroporphyrinogen-III C-methyltransferase n=1 Tax=Hymenobacter rubidus TaxID=1441626 RepID=UPI00192020E0|nr:uroporphyrinogen-III C-methyltransferase [Hymenobacter rubidus]